MRSNYLSCGAGAPCARGGIVEFNNSQWISIQ